MSTLVVLQQTVSQDLPKKSGMGTCQSWYKFTYEFRISSVTKAPCRFVVKNSKKFKAIIIRVLSRIKLPPNWFVFSRAKSPNDSSPKDCPKCDIKNPKTTSCVKENETVAARADGKTPLHLACVEGNLTEVKKLISLHTEGSDRKNFIDKLDNDGDTPLDIAISKGHPEIVSFLIDEKADLGFLDQMIRLAVCNKECGDRMVQILLDAIPSSVRPDYLNADDNIGNTAMHWACYKGNLKSVEILLKAGAMVASTNNHGQTPLMAAVWGDKNDIFTLLMKHIGREAALNYINREREEPCVAIVTSNRIASLDDAAKYIKENGNLALLPKISGEIDKSVKVGVVGTMSNAVSRFSPVKNAKDSVETKIANCIHAAGKEGLTVMHLAAWRGNLDAVDLIFKAGGKLCCQNSKGETPLMLAASEGHSKVLKYLLKVVGTFGVSKVDYVNMKRKDGDTALVIAVREGHDEAAQCLLEAIKGNASMKLEELLRLAAVNRKANAKVVEAVLNAIPDADKSEIVNAVDNNGNSALHLASLKGTVGLIDLLVKAGGKIYKPNRGGKMPLVLASNSGHEHAVVFILNTYYKLRECFDYE